MSALIIGGAIAVTASIAFSLGLWFGSHKRNLRENELEARLASLQHVVDRQRDATATATQRALDAMGDLVTTSVRLLRRQRGAS